MMENPTSYFFQKKVTNFDIVHHKCRGEPLEDSYKNYKTIKNDDFKNFRKNDKEKVLPEVFRNIKREDLWIKRDLMIDYFKKKF